MAWTAAAGAADSGPFSQDVTFEELANTPVTTVGRKEQRYVSTPAALYVLTREDVESTGDLSVLDALRLAPGVHVGQINAHSWGVAVRGFNSLHADKLVVLIDNRSVYTPLWSGVYWEQHEWLADEIERIEVVRGPGGAKWGTNAVNGAINIFSRSARDTQGLAAVGGAGSENEMFGSLRYGGALGESGWFRTFAGYKERNPSANASGGAAQDAGSIARGGFRYDGVFGGSDLLVQAGAFKSDMEQNIQAATLTPPYSEPLPDGESEGAYVQGLWTFRSSRLGRITVQSYFDHSNRDVLASAERRRTFDVEAQQVVDWGERHQLAWGLGYRRSEDENENNLSIALSPPSETTELFSLFAEDEIAAPEIDMAFTLGAKFEHNDDTGWEVQPSARLAWTPTPFQTFWSAVTRAVRRPSRINQDLVGTAAVLPAGASGPGSPTTLVQITGGADLDSEDMLSYEAGWRMAGEQRSLDVATFYSDYRSLIGFSDFVLDTQTLAPQFWRLVSQQQNRGDGHSYGAEAAVSWTPSSEWTLRLNYSWLELDLAPTTDPLLARSAGSSPRHTLSARSTYARNEQWRVDLTLRYVDELRFLAIDDYLTADLAFTWDLSAHLELGVFGRNLLQDQHPEFATADIVEGTEVERSAFVRLSWRTE